MPRAHPMAIVRKGCVDVSQGEVHFRYGGRGPTVVLLHESPRSSRLHVPTIEWLGEHFTVVALDVPGHGRSSPLPIDAPTIPDFARALDEALTALGIGRCALYGCHTSAKIALQFAADQPQRVALAVLDGLSLPAELPDDEYLSRYLPPFVPTPDGDYIVRQWTKMLDFHRYFPWHTLAAESRYAADLPDDRALHAYATDMFLAGRHGSGAYGAALRYAAGPVISQLRSPTVFMCRQDDYLYTHLDRLPLVMPSGSRVLRVPDAPGAWRQQLLGLLREGARDVPDWQPPAPSSRASAHWQRHRYVELPHGQVRVGLRGGSTRATPTLLLPDLPGTSRQLDAYATELATDRLVISPELPGLGESDPLPSPTLGAYVALLEDVLVALDCEKVDVVAEGLGTAFACALAANRPRRVRRMLLDGVPMVRLRDRRRYVREYCPAVVPDRAGSHLVRLFEQLRSAHMTWPWFERTAAAARERRVDLDPEILHAALTDHMCQPDSYGDAARAALEAALRDIVKGVEQPVLVLQDARDTRYYGTGSVKRRLGNATVRARPEAASARASACREFLD